MKGSKPVRSKTYMRGRGQTGFFQSILDALAAHIAVIDQAGTIVATNAAWLMFAETNGMTWADFGIGRNYIEICEKATGAFSEEASDIAKNMRLLLNGQLEQYYCEYPCQKSLGQKKLTDLQPVTSKLPVLIYEGRIG
jgi:hypothetical protein